MTDITIKCERKTILVLGFSVLNCVTFTPVFFFCYGTCPVNLFHTTLLLSSFDWSNMCVRILHSYVSDTLYKLKHTLAYYKQNQVIATGSLDCSHAWRGKVAWFMASYNTNGV